MRKGVNILPVISLVFIMLVGSCSIEKRHHLKGYHVEWKGLRSDNAKAKRLEKDSKQAVVNSKEKAKTTVASADKLIETDKKLLHPIATNDSKIKSVQSPKENNLTASLNDGPVSLNEWSSLSDNVARNQSDTTKVKNRKYYPSVRSRGQKFSNLSAAFFVGSILVYPLILTVPIFAIMGIVNSNREINAEGDDEITESVRQKAFSGRTTGIVVLAIWTALVVIAISFAILLSMTDGNL